ncbi:glycoside hydrolase family 13 protein [Oribacterium sp. WCC10]|uniref:glycoside hydrolase family 13 protein n=1 Tax=Oribacterium sp. WCC10 TaxID=1855343 RepID=UPI0008F32534|nr:alpha-glucosidase [Oribacterium sp. WCC10]SFG51459.1 oligo-1,6-glucosidase [Oribacterium sp. WCC10]
MKEKWWHDKVAYQIYPKSFKDSNGDGIGDIRGIIEKLDYLQELGIDLLWLSPIYCSPLADQGYDISDYYNIDPRFGTLEDLDELIAEGKKRNIGIVMDLVVNHCSDEHEWFKKAIEDPDGPYGKFFYIEDYKKGDKLPCNWRSYFGGSCWEPLPGHEDKLYLHVFHKKQPDLNWENPLLRKEIYKMINWWLDRGIAGFRIDAIINIKKKLPFCDYPADRADGLSSIENMLKEATGIGEFLNEMADECFRKHDSFTVGEVFNEKDSDLPLFIGEDGYFSTMFDFSTTFIDETGISTVEPVKDLQEKYKKASFKAHKRVDGIGLLSNIIENHDEPRGVSRYIPKEDLSDKSKKMLAGVYFMMPGVPFIYQGQEIGMENLSEVKSLSELDDCANPDLYRRAIEDGLTEEEALKLISLRSRDNARTPFQWSGDVNAGFSDAEPWLMLNPKYKDINLEKQHDDPESVFSFYKKLIKLRKDKEYERTVVYGDFEPYEEEKKNLLCFKRILDKRILVAANYQREPQVLELDEKVKAVLISNNAELAEKVTEAGTRILLQGYDYLVAELGEE